MFWLIFIPGAAFIIGAYLHLMMDIFSDPTESN